MLLPLLPSLSVPHLLRLCNEGVLQLDCTAHFDFLGCHQLAPQLGANDAAAAARGRAEGGGALNARAVAEQLHAL